MNKDFYKFYSPQLSYPNLYPKNKSYYQLDREDDSNIIYYYPNDKKLIVTKQTRNMIIVSIFYNIKTLLHALAVCNILLKED